MTEIGPFEAALRARRDAGGKALVPYLTGGLGDDWLDTIRAVADAGADGIEIGIPFSDPMADGMTIQRSSFEAIRKGVTLRWIFDQLDTVVDEIDTPMVMMSYLNPLLSFGYDVLAERALATGVCGFIVPDLPYEESEELREALEVRDLGLIQLVTPATPDDRLNMLCDESLGFVYAVTITGITGGDEGLPSLKVDVAAHVVPAFAAGWYHGGDQRVRPRALAHEHG